MRPALLSALVVCTFARAASANDEHWRFTVPEGYTLTDGGEAAGKLAQMRVNEEMGSSDARLYVSADQAVHLLASFLIVRKRDDPTATWTDLEGIDRMMRVQLAERAFGGPVSGSSHREGAILVSDVTYTLGDQVLDEHQLAGFDAEHVIHTFKVMCVGPEQQLAACKAAQQSMRLDVQNPAMPATLPWSVTVPDGYVNFDDGQQAKLQRMRTPDVELADIHLYETADRVRRIGVMGMVYKYDHVPTWRDLEEMDRQAVEGGKRMGKQVSASTSRKGPVLMALQSVDLQDDVHQFYSRFYGVDAKNRIYAVSVMCMGVAMKATECADVQRSLRVDIPDQRSPIDAASKPVGERAMTAGYWAVLLGLVVAVLVLFVRVTRRRRRRRH